MEEVGGLMRVWDWNIVHTDWDQGTVTVTGGFQTSIEVCWDDIEVWLAKTASRVLGPFNADSSKNLSTLSEADLRPATKWLTEYYRRHPRITAKMAIKDCAETLGLTHLQAAKALKFVENRRRRGRPLNLNH